MRIAVLDLGSNSFHLVVVDADDRGSFAPVMRSKVMLGLGAVVARHGTIAGHDAERAISTAGRLVGRARETGATTVLACATAAIRQAANGAELVAEMEARTGVRIEVLSGVEEARLVFRAVVPSIDLRVGPALCLDVGGGSLEVVVGDRRGPGYLASTELGATRLAAELIDSDPPSPDEVAAVRRRIASSLGPIVGQCAHLRPTVAVATGGVVRDLGRLLASRRPEAPTADIDQTRVSLDELRRLEGELLALSTAERAALPGIKRARALPAPLGAGILTTALECFGIGELTIARWGLREGILLRHLAGSAGPVSSG